MEGVGQKDPEAFAALLDNDQLTSALATSASFPGFQELTLPEFAPTYKKKVRLVRGVDDRNKNWVIQRGIPTWPL